MRWILACVVCAIVALIWDGWSAAPVPAPPARELEVAESPAPRAGWPVELAAGEREDVRAPAQAAEPAAPPPEPAPEPDLAALLRRVGATWMEQDTPGLERALETLLEQPARCEEALSLLEHGGLRGDELASAGAVLGLGVAVARYSVADGRVAVDAQAFTGHVLERLAYVLPPEQQDLADQLIQARVGERYVLDLAYLGKILELRRLHPAQAEVYSSLLVHMVENLQGEAGLEEFRTLFLDRGEDPTAVKLALSALLRHDASTWLPLAEDLFGQARGDARLQSAIAHAIATSAPLPQACAALGRIAAPGLYVEFALLGLREGGTEALAQRYSDLVASASQPMARRMLVSALRAESESVLLGIARTDPDPEVRTQALLTASLGRAASLEFVDELCAAHRRRADPGSGLKTAHALLVAGNVLLNTSGEERERAQQLLLAIAGDATESDGDRWTSVRMLKAWVPPGTFQGWTIGGVAVE